MVAVKIHEIEAELKANTAKLKKLESKKSKLETKFQDIKNKEIIARQAYDECMGK